MTDAELIQSLRTAIAYHETQAERYRRMLAIAEDDALIAKGPKAKRSGEHRRPPSGRKAGGLREQVATWLKDHPTGTAAECGAALGRNPTSVAYHLTALRPVRKRAS